MYRVHENVKIYVTFNKESNENVAVYHELLSAQILPGWIHYIRTQSYYVVKCNEVNTFSVVCHGSSMDATKHFAWVKMLCM